MLNGERRAEVDLDRDGGRAGRRREDDAAALREVRREMAADDLPGRPPDRLAQRDRRVARPAREARRYSPSRRMGAFTESFPFGRRSFRAFRNHDLRILVCRLPMRPNLAFNRTPGHAARFSHAPVAGRRLT